MIEHRAYKLKPFKYSNSNPSTFTFRDDRSKMFEGPQNSIDECTPLWMPTKSPSRSSSLKSSYIYYQRMWLSSRHTQTASVNPQVFRLEPFDIHILWWRLQFKGIPNGIEEPNFPWAPKFIPSRFNSLTASYVLYQRMWLNSRHTWIASLNHDILKPFWFDIHIQWWPL